MTSNSLVKSSSRLDQRHGCRRLTVCSVVWPGCWLRRTEAHHDDLLTQWWADTVQPGTLEPCRADTGIQLQPLGTEATALLLLQMYYYWLVWQQCITDLQSNKHGEELSSVSNQHAVTDARQLFTDGVFNQYWRHVLSTGRDQNLYNHHSNKVSSQKIPGLFQDHRNIISGPSWSPPTIKL